MMNYFHEKQDELAGADVRSLKKIAAQWNFLWKDKNEEYHYFNFQAKRGNNRKYPLRFFIP